MLTEYQIEAIGQDDVRFWSNCPTGCWMHLNQLIDDSMAFTETVMCKANADEVYNIKCALENAADKIQKWYDTCKNNNFEKICPQCRQPYLPNTNCGACRG